MKKTFRLFASLFMLPALLIAVAGTVPAMASPAAQAGAQTWTVLAGGESAPEPGPEHPISAWTYTRFYPTRLPFTSVIPSYGSLTGWRSTRWFSRLPARPICLSFNPTLPTPRLRCSTRWSPSHKAASGLSI